MKFTAAEIRFAQESLAWSSRLRPFRYFAIALSVVLAGASFWAADVGHGTAETLAAVASRGGETAEEAVAAAHVVGRNTGASASSFASMSALLFLGGVLGFRRSSRSSAIMEKVANASATQQGAPGDA